MVSEMVELIAFAFELAAIERGVMSTGRRYVRETTASAPTSSLSRSSTDSRVGALQKMIGLHPLAGRCRERLIARFAPITDIETKILSRLRAQYGRVSIERLLCGAGIMNIYRALADIRGLGAEHTTPESVGSAAQAGEDALAGETMNTFFSVLGSAAGNLALTLGARGGVYLAGGIAPQYIDLLRKSDFRARFLAKGRFADFNREIATMVITHPDPGLLGAALICSEGSVDGR